MVYFPVISDASWLQGLIEKVVSMAHQSHQGESRTDLTPEVAQALIEAAPDAFLMVDALGRILFSNHQAEVLFGYACADLRAMRLEDLLPERLRTRHVTHRQGYVAAPHTRPMGIGLELFGRRNNGEEFPVEISLSPMVDGESPLTIAIVRDVTQRKQLEAAVRAAEREAEHVKDEFIAIAAHELRNPLAALKGFADMLRVQTARGHGPTLADWQTEAIASIDQAASRLVELTDDLLDVTRLQAGRLELHPAPHDLVALVQRVIARQQVTTQQHTITLHTDLSHLTLTFDPLRMEQVLNNLLNNAIKYSPDAHAISVTLNKDSATGTVTLSVRDHGIGIPATQHRLLFQRFGRADNAQGIGGTGLGLYLCREIVERHQGRIWFTSEAEQGATFYVTLPLSPEDAATGRAG